MANAARQIEANQTPAGNAPDLSKLRYLIVDDSRYARRLIRDALYSYGLRHTREAADASAAITMLQSDPIDVLLLDNELPVISGTELTLLVRKGEREIPNPEIPIIMISGFTDPDRVVEARNAGIHEYLAKPISADALYRRIRTTIYNPRPFIRCKTYIGPDRRWVDKGNANGPDRRGGAINNLPRPPLYVAAGGESES
jgi:PleD family two-component response regulator